MGNGNTHDKMNHVNYNESEQRLCYKLQGELGKLPIEIGMFG